MTGLDLTSAVEAAAIALHDHYCPAGSDCREPSTSLGNWHERAAIAVKAAMSALFAQRGTADVDSFHWCMRCNLLVALDQVDAHNATAEHQAAPPYAPKPGPGKPDDLDALCRRMDEATPGAVVELRAEVARLETELSEARPGVAAALWAYRRERQAHGADSEVLRVLFQACRIADDATTRRLRNEAARESSVPTADGA